MDAAPASRPTLEAWIARILARPLDQLNAQCNADSFWTASDEVESWLGDTRDYRKWSDAADEKLVTALHGKIRGQECESAIWSAILFYAGALPDTIANDLIDRDIVLTALGHTRQSDAVQWRLAGLVDEALLTLFHDYYTRPQYSLEDVEKLLARFPSHGWLFEKWDVWAAWASSQEKEIAFHRWVWQHPLRRSTLPSPEQYLEAIAAREREAVEAKLRLEQEREAEQRRIEAERRGRQLEMERISTTLLKDEEIERILAAKEPDSLSALAGNMLIEKRWVEKLRHCYGVKGARAIREVVAENLDVR